MFLDLSRRHAALLVVSVSVVVAFSVVARAQTGATGVITGTVVDESSAVLSGVSVTIVNIGTNGEQATTTTDDGGFSFALLSPGAYRVAAVLDGFRPTESRTVVEVGGRYVVTLTLRIAGGQETVYVSGAATERTPAVSTVVNRQFVENMPLNGRGFLALLTAVPGVTLTAGGAGPLDPQGQFSVNGQRANANYFTVDGVSANIGVNASEFLHGSGSGVLPGLSALGGTNSLVSVDALEEFRVVTSTSAPEYGRMPGAQVSIVTRSGSNQHHGSLFDYIRNDALDANDWFAERASLPKPELKQHDFGGVWGGPVIKNQLFFFGSYEALRLQQPQSGVTAVPSLATRQTAPAGLRPFLNAYPLPTGADLGNGTAEFASAFSNRGRLDAGSLRVDATPRSNMRIFVRYNDAPSSTTQRAANGSAVTSQGVVESRTQTLTVGGSQILSAHATHDLRANWSHSRGGTRYGVDAFAGATVPDNDSLFPGYPADVTRSVSFGVQGIPLLLAGDTAKNTLTQINIVDTVSLAVGRHLLQAGGDVRRIVSGPEYEGGLVYFQWPRFTGIGTLASDGSYPVGTVMSGRPRTTSVAVGQGARLRFLTISAYAQDTWRATNQLTLTYGLRWDVNPAPTGVDGTEVLTLADVDHPATFALAPKGTPLYATRYTNVAPRAAASYLLRQGSGYETVIRGGVGTFYDVGFGATGGVSSEFPNLVYRSVPGQPYPLSPSLAAPPALSTTYPISEILVADPHLQAPRTYQWNAAVDQEIGDRQTMSVAYVGALGRKLLRNEYIAGANADVNGVLIVRNASESSFHSLQLTYQRRFSRGLQALASYTLAKSEDLGSNDASWFNRPAADADPNQDRGPSDFDVRHAFKATVSYDVPAPRSGRLRPWLLGIGLDTLVTARSATPVDLVGGIAFLQYVITTRPDVVPGQPFYLDDADAPGGRRLNAAAFAPTPTDEFGSAARQGTLGRNVVRGFPLFQIDMAARRTFRLPAGLALQLRFEAFNLLNHTNFANPVGDLSSGLFGRSTTVLSRGLGSDGATGGLNPLYQVGGPRSMQLAVRLTF